YTTLFRSTKLLRLADRTYRLACDAGCRGVASLLDYFSCEKRMCRIDARVDDGDHHPAAVVSGVPDLIALNERHAVGQHRLHQFIVEDADRVARGFLERRDPGRRHLEGDVRHRLVFTHYHARHSRAEPAV